MIARGNGDVSFGNERVGKQVDEIEFVPLKKENYDMIVRIEDLQKPAYKALIDIIQSEEFKEEVKALRGYDVSGMGERIY
jgi:putative molybdopterin biosynthesis protein